MSTALKDKVQALPTTPGIYKFKNDKGVIIYVGKAKSLRDRVRSYFQGNLDTGSKTYALVSRIKDIEYIEALSEIEALILEAELIKKYQPKYNIALKDDKSYLYIVVRNETFEMPVDDKAAADVGPTAVAESSTDDPQPQVKKVAIPKVITARKTDLLPRDTVFGPYPDGNTAKYIVKTIRKFLPFRDCTGAKFTRYKKMGKPCLYGYIGLCSGPCAGNVSIENYREEVSRVKKFLSGGSVNIVNSLKREMDSASKNEQFEKAAQFRDTIRKFEYIRQSFKTANKYIENPYLVEDLIAKSLDELVNTIPILKDLPKRIECYDISNISGKEAVGSMVVATGGRIDKSQYRKFRIKFRSAPDDFEMMREVLTRRFNNDWERPDLLVLDGGKGQVSTVAKALDDLNVDIPLIGLAKRLETIVFLKDGEFIEVNLAKTNEGLKLLQRLRDEAHRFAQRYHHHLRLKKITG